MSYRELKQHGTEDFPIAFYHIDKNHTRFEMASHWHSHIEIIRIISGELNIKLYNNEYIATAGDVVFVNSETVHGATPTYDCIYECVVLHTEMLEIRDNGCKFFIDGMLNGEYAVKEFHKAENSPFINSVNAIFDAMIKLENIDGESRFAMTASKFFIIGAIYSLFAAIIDGKLYSAVSIGELPEDKNLEKLKCVLSYIRSNYDKQISLSDMAKVASMSPKYFCHFFKSMTRKTPVDYLVAYRVEKASRKLLSTDMSVTDIAFATGFNDLSYFIKTFKRINGRTPAGFRKG